MTVELVTKIINNEEVEVVAQDNDFIMHLETIWGFTYQEYLNDKNGYRERITLNYEDEIESMNGLMEGLW